MHEERPVLFTSTIHSLLSVTEGKVLTVIDAILEGNKNAATKSLIRQAFSSAHNEVQDRTLHGDRGNVIIE